MGRPKAQRRKKGFKAAQGQYMSNVKRDYKTYLDIYYKSPNEKKGERMTFDQFEEVYYDYYMTKQKQTKGGKAFQAKQAKQYGFAQTVFEQHTSAFTEDELKVRKEAIWRARKELEEGVFKTNASIENQMKFLTETYGLEEEALRTNWNYYVGLLLNLFDSREEFEAWISPTVEFDEI